MAATRKLQGEIDRCLKKVTEGVETFEDIWQKVHNATNSNQKVIKEKYEADLKKEIKKLQRLRDQIKSWIASAEIKDKSALLENRRLIETQMERFKIVERETKTKAYSKEGLGAAQKLDPAQRVKDEIRNWLTTSISSLQIQIDQYESEIESLLAAKKKRLDRDKQDRMDELRSKLDRHKFHITKLETLLRLLDNDGVEVKQVARIKEDVEYYIESSQDPDFEENEYMYDEIIGLDEVELSGTGIPSSATTDSNNSNETGGSPSSLVSGGSPVLQSPAALNCSNANNLNYSSDSTSVEFTSADKRNKNENNASSKPVKPTAVRANNKADANSNSSSSNTSNSLQTTPQQQQQSASLLSSSLQSAPISVLSLSTTSLQQNKNIISSTPSKNPQSHGLASLIGGSGNSTTSATLLTTSSGSITSFGASVVAAVNNINNQQQQNSSSNLHNSTTSNNQAQSSVIQPQQPIAFAAVAKNNTSHLENGPIHPPTSYTMATAASILVGSNVQQTQQPQTQQHTNLQTNSSHQTSDSSATHNNTSTSNSIGSSIVTIAATVAAAVANSSNNTISNVVGNNNTLGNCISPISSMTNSSSRGSPGLLSPKQMNGPLTHNSNSNNNNNNKSNMIPVSAAAVAAAAAAVNSNISIDAMSTLKTMAQEVINRAAIDTNLQAAPTPNNVDTRQQQQHQPPTQHQQIVSSQQQQSSQHFSPAVTDTTANNNNNNNTNGLANQLQNNSSTVGVPSSGSIGSNGNSNSGNGNTGVVVPSSGKTISGTNEAYIPPLLGVAPLGTSPLHKEHQLQFQMMEAAYYHLPAPSDSEKLTTYLHRQPIQTPPHYPQSQLPHSDTVEFFQRLSTETLFFIFYYMEGTKAQYLAAKALKKQSWRFHTKYMMWFQRHEEPKVINDEYEQGTYIYFDYEKWGQRKKEGFTFEYRFLEDKDLN